MPQHLILTTKPFPGYDDIPEERYHFPKTYLNQVQAGVGEWIIYYEPRRTHAGKEATGGRQSYFATALLDRVESDPGRADHFYAYVKNYLDFDSPVPFRAKGGSFFEARLRAEDGSTNLGLFQRAVRAISPQEYDLITRSGVTSLDKAPDDGDFVERTERPIKEKVVRRWVRDPAFSVLVRRAYSDTCAVTGISILNGNNSAEMEAAHIRPAAPPDNGPDSVRNGIAISGTFHWLFDHGFLSVKDDYSLLVASRGVPEKLKRLINEDGRLHLPNERRSWPHPKFLAFHRTKFKG